MGVASSIFTQLVLNICWKFRLYLEDGDDVCGIQSPSITGFLNTPEATSTPVSPCSTSGLHSIDSSLTAALPATSQRPRRRKHRRQRKERVSELLSPVEEERLRIAGLGKNRSRMGITPSIPKRAPLAARNAILVESIDLVNLSAKSQSFMALDLAVKPSSLQKRVGLRV